MESSAVRLENVTKQFGKQRAVSEFNLEIPEGSIYGLLGPNGSGKTTTIRMIMGILGPDTGRVVLFGGDPAETRRQNVGYLPEERGLYQRMKVLEQLVFLARIRGISRADARSRAGKWLERLNLSEHADKKVEDLSKGMQQKVQFIGTVLHEPRLLILDEPFSGLDPINQDVLESIVREFNDKGTTILFSTHLMDQAERLCRSVCLISSSFKVLDGELADIKRREHMGVVAVDFEGPRDWLDGPGIVGLEESPTGVRIRLEDGTEAQRILERALRSKVRLTRFEVVQPRLHEIFVRHARGAAAPPTPPTPERRP